MIKGNLDGNDFIIIDGDVSCMDKSTYKYIKAICEIVYTGFQPQDGDPELYVIDNLEKSGAKKPTMQPDAIPANIQSRNP